MNSEVLRCCCCQCHYILHARAICCKFNQFIIELLKRNLPYKYNGVVKADNLYRIMYIIINPCMHYLAYICIATSTIYVRGGSCTIQFTTASLCVLHPSQMPGDVKSTPYSKARFSIAYFEDTQKTQTLPKASGQTAKTSLPDTMPFTTCSCSGFIAA